MRIRAMSWTVLGIMSGLVGHAAAGAAPDAPLAPGASRLTLQAFDPGQNLVHNGSFENAANGIPTGWLWDRRNTDATLTLDTQNPHTGRHPVKITNGTASARMCSAALAGRAIPVKPLTRYTIPRLSRRRRRPRRVDRRRRGLAGASVLPATRPLAADLRTFVDGERERPRSNCASAPSPADAVWIDDLSLRRRRASVPAVWMARRSQLPGSSPAAPPK
jgi:hypothetical protein